MKKRILIVRHAKSDWGNEVINDFYRPLNNRGHENAPEMAARLLKNKFVPEKIITSPAIRAFTTAQHFAEAFDYDVNALQLDKNIYEASVSVLLNVINKADEQYNFIALFGHNNGVSDLVNYLTDKNISSLATCATVIIQFDTHNWDEISAGTGKIIYHDYPKNE